MKKTRAARAYKTSGIKLIALSGPFSTGTDGWDKSSAGCIAVPYSRPSPQFWHDVPFPVMISQSSARGRISLQRCERLDNRFAVRSLHEGEENHDP
jgi:hypothetical protein